MKKFWVIVLLLINYQFVNAQYTEIINSKRPGLSESPYGVGTDVIQVETGVFFGKNTSNATFSKISPQGVNLFLRYGKLMEKLEINANITYQKNELQFNNIFTSTKDIKGISQLTIGAKYLIFQQEFDDKSKEIRSWKKRTEFDKKRLIPSVGVYLGLNTNFVGEEYKEEGMSPKAAILLQNDFTQRLILITNLIADRIGKDNKSYSYIATMTYSITDQWSFFVENEGDFYVNKTDFQIGTGAAYLYTKDLQFDASIRTNLNSNESSYIASVGVAWRLDRHSDKLIERDTNGNKKKRGGGFFSRIFKKKNK
ncbi:MAG: transporter [Urechidicola sp.]|jgi:hypothetical protein